MTAPPPFLNLFKETITGVGELGTDSWSWKGLAKPTPRLTTWGYVVYMGALNCRYPSVTVNKSFPNPMNQYSSGRINLHIYTHAPCLAFSIRLSCQYLIYQF